MFEFESVAGDGVLINVHDWEPDTVRAVVIIAHGAAEHGARYARVAQRLNEHGYAVYAPDHRGHGRTGQAAIMGVFAASDGWNKAVADLDQLVSLARQRHPGVPVALIGHSMGSFMAQQYLGEYGTHIDALVLSGSTELSGFADLIPLLQAEAAQQGRDAPSVLMGQMMGGGFNEGFTDGDTGYEWLSRDPVEVARYVDDPLCGFELSTGAWLDMIAANRIPAEPTDFGSIDRHLPIYLFAGEHDPVNAGMTGLRALERVYSNAGFDRLDTCYYPEGRHEMLNETNRDQVTDNLVRWLDTHLLSD